MTIQQQVAAVEDDGVVDGAAGQDLSMVSGYIVGDQVSIWSCQAEPSFLTMDLTSWRLFQRQAYRDGLDFDTLGSDSLTVIGPLAIQRFGAVRMVQMRHDNGQTIILIPGEWDRIIRGELRDTDHIVGQPLVPAGG